MTMRIGLDDLQLTLAVGVTPQERVQMQQLFLDVVVEADLTEAVAKDEIAHSIDYERIAALLQTFVTSHNTYHLIETLAQRLAEHLFAHLPIDWLSLRVKKPKAVCTAKCAWVELKRYRDEML